ncbi:MAG: carboxypeptidase-like regulatory domain-containing protein, partial [Bacteroidota bacterium]
MQAQMVSLSGTIRDKDNNPIDGVTIAVKELPQISTQSNEQGFYTLKVEKNKTFTLVFYSINHVPYNQTITTSADNNQLSPILKFKNELITVEVTDFKSRSEETVRLDAKVYSQIPTPTGNLEDIIKTQMGVSSNNELSSGYSVRGGNFDENLVYVNDIEVYRPFLVRSGQQEGLSFANPNMVQNIQFSAGGFEAKYGDKLSSVLDITYRKPLKFSGNASASFLGGNAQVEDISNNRLIAWNIGARYRTNSYL